MEEKKIIEKEIEVSLEEMANISGGKSSPSYMKCPCPFCGQEFSLEELDQHHLKCAQRLSGN